MSYLKKKGQVRLSIAASLIIGFGSFVADSLGQSDTRAGGPGAFQTQDSSDTFDFPDIPEVPGADQSALNPQAFQFQDKTVNEKYAGWRQAADGNDGARLDDTIRAHWVMADDTGSLTGVVYGIEGADLGNFKISLINNGRVVTSTLPKEDGTFNFPNAKQDTYSLIGWGDNAFFAFSFNILRYNEAADENVPTRLEITAVPNETTINTDWIKYFAEGVRFPVYGRFETEEGEEDPPRLYGVEGQSLYLPVARPATSISSHQIIPASDGRVIGRVHQISTRNGRPVDLRNTRIMLLKKDDVYAAVTTDSYGVFEFPEIPSGEYSCVAAGHDGLGCIGITIADDSSTAPDANSVLDDGEEDEEADMSDDTFTPISFAMVTSETTGWLNSLAIETAYQRVISRPIINYETPQPTTRRGPGCPPQGKLRPGGYRPLPRSAVPAGQGIIPRFNRFLDKAFTRDAPGF